MKVKKLFVVLLCVGIAVGILSAVYFITKKSNSNDKNNETSSIDALEDKSMRGKAAPQAVFPLKDQLATSTEYSSFVKDLQVSGLYDKLLPEGIYTILVVNNDNYATLKAQSAARFNTNESISKTLSHHVIRGRHIIQTFGLNTFPDAPKEDSVQLLDMNDQQLLVKRIPDNTNVEINGGKFKLVKDIYTQTAVILEVDGIIPE